MHDSRGESRGDNDTRFTFLNAPALLITPFWRGRPSQTVGQRLVLRQALVYIGHKGDVFLGSQGDGTASRHDIRIPCASPSEAANWGLCGFIREFWSRVIAAPKTSSCIAASKPNMRCKL